MATVNFGKAGKEAKPAKFDKGAFHIMLEAASQEPFQVQADTWKGVDNVGLRQLFRGQADGQLYYGKQGVNIPVEDFVHATVALIECYNAATGSNLSLKGSNEAEAALVSDAMSLVEEEAATPTEDVQMWRRR